MLLAIAKASPPAATPKPSDSANAGLPAAPARAT